MSSDCCSCPDIWLEKCPFKWTDLSGEGQKQLLKGDKTFLQNYFKRFSGKSCSKTTAKARGRSRSRLGRKLKRPTRNTSLATAEWQQSCVGGGRKGEEAEGEQDLIHLTVPN